MSNQELNHIAEELKQYRMMLEELKSTIDTLEQRIKSHMDESGIDTLILTSCKIIYKDITTTRLDSTALRKELPEIAARYSKTSTAKRFTIQ